MNIFNKAKQVGLIQSSNAGKSAAQLRKDNPALATKFATFVSANRGELIKAIAKSI